MYTCQGEVRRIVRSAVLLWDHMFYVEDEGQFLVLMDMTILAPIRLPMPPIFESFGVNYRPLFPGGGPDDFLTTSSAPSIRLANSIFSLWK